MANPDSNPPAKPTTHGEDHPIDASTEAPAGRPAEGSGSGPHRGRDPVRPAPGSPRRGRRGAWIAGLLVLLLAGGGWYWYSQRGASDAGQAGQPGPGGRIPGGPGGPGGPGRGMSGPAAPVVVSPVVQRDMDVVLNGLGNVTPVANVTVRAQVSGPLLRVLFKEGQMVKAGDLLAEIDPRPFQAALDQALGQLARDQALLQNARIDQQRYRTLLAQDSIAKQQVDTQDALVRQYEGVVKTDQANVDNARLQLGYTRIKAPTSGRIGLRQVDPGNIVSTSDANGIALITQIQPIAVLFSIPEDNLPSVLRQLNAGQTLPVQAWDRQARNKLADGTLLTTDNQIDTTTGTVRLKAVFRNDDGMLFPNQFVNVRMRVDTLAGATVVPVAAIQRGQQGTFVYVVDQENKVKVQTVALGPSDGEQTAVLRGVQAGQRVVVDGADRLREGMTVQTVDPAARAAAVAPASEPRARGRRLRAGGASGPEAAGPRGPRPQDGASAPAAGAAPSASPSAASASAAAPAPRQ
ncbi:MdtA/MuxA family multidrug efflux RND transporter periplasmic adaptor subunit [Cupriavidus gilardii]|uniref:MdtA/MuxA family multidrug efflux RND transporter periplasmic adaptor subunit n=1 Tax=Cupriavidus gilardii TaxID=82541 RepID=A0ABY4VUJ0_9BURK|nr:MdtA/MuxA family multidrug efflux RND transporter periplasmic adaptor subunit [Cupriavidus gilardii]MCT9115024.1 MdtA/MuxA family multidrug efflux RND transporter periplasmic adaptor subunit [Cupriavidus gilardii]USE80854.1 MdtA/MuxA family multidrug efflux RND transporter periplasmic adaptor subunit [Cupriavidus gilardii]